MDESSLNWILVAQPGVPSVSVAPSEFLERHERLGSDEFLWVHLNYDHNDTADILAKLGVSTEIAGALLATESRPKCHVSGQDWLIILRAINKNVEEHPEMMISLRLWVTPKLLVTMRRSNWPIVSIRELKQILQSGSGPQSPHEAALQLTELLTLKVKESVDNLEDGMAEMEDSQGQRFDVTRSQLSKKRREASGLRRFLVPQRDALELIARHKGLDESCTFWARDLVDKNTRYIEDLDLVREKALVLQDDLRANISDEQNQRMYVLSIVSAIFLPLSFLTGMFGMNVAGLPGTEYLQAFWVLTGGMGLVACGIWAYMWKKGWF